MIAPRRGSRAPVIGHVLASSTDAVDKAFFAYRAVPEAARARQHLVVSAWVWIPRDFSGTFVTALLAGWPRLYGRNADLDRREVWQLTWSSAAVPAETADALVCLAVAGSQGDTLYSSEWRLHADTAPPTSILAQDIGRP